MMPATPPSPLPQPTLGHHNLGTCSGQARPSGQLAQMGDKVRQPQGWLHRQLRVARKPQQEFGQGVAGCCRNIQDGLRGHRSSHRRDRSGHRQLLSCRRCGQVAQPPEAKVSGVAKPPPRVAEPLQPWAGSSAQPPQDALVQCMPPNLPASHALVASSLHYHLQGGCISSLVGLLHRLFFCLELASQLFVHLGWGQLLHLYSGALPWALELVPALARPPGHLDHPPKFQPLPAKLPSLPVPVQVH